MAAALRRTGRQVTARTTNSRPARGIRLAIDQADDQLRHVVPGRGLATQDHAARRACALLAAYLLVAKRFSFTLQPRAASSLVARGEALPARSTQRSDPFRSTRRAKSSAG